MSGAPADWARRGVMLAWVSLLGLASAASGQDRIDLQFSAAVRGVESLGSQRLLVLVGPLPGGGDDVKGEGASTSAEADEVRSRKELFEAWTVELAGAPPRLHRVYQGRLQEPLLESADLRGDGRLRPLIRAVGEVVELATAPESGTSARHLVPGYWPGAVAQVGGASPWLPVVQPGELTLWQLGVDELLLDRTVALPLLTERRGWGLRLSSPPVTLRSRSRDEGAELLVGPRVVGSQRLQTIRIHPDGSQEESWSLLDGQEEVQSSRYVDVDGETFLEVLTRPPGGLFSKLSLLLFPLDPDRSRSGVPPRLRVDLDCHVWHEPTIGWRDEDGDGRTDLLVAHPEGLGGGDLVVLRYHGRGQGRFAPIPERRKISIKEAIWWLHDLDGDGRSDLVLWKEELELYRGLGTRRLWQRKPIVLPSGSWQRSGALEVEVAVGGSTSASVTEVDDLWFLPPRDVDGDGRLELLYRVPLPRDEATGETRGERLVIRWLPATE